MYFPCDLISHILLTLPYCADSVSERKGHRQRDSKRKKGERKGYKQRDSKREKGESRDSERDIKRGTDTDILLERETHTQVHRKKTDESA